MRTPPPPPRDNLRFSNTTGILQKKTMWFIGVKVEQVTSAPPPKKNSGSAPVDHRVPYWFRGGHMKRTIPVRCERFARTINNEGVNQC